MKMMDRWIDGEKNREMGGNREMGRNREMRRNREMQGNNINSRIVDDTTFVQSIENAAFNALLVLKRYYLVSPSFQVYVQTYKFYKGTSTAKLG
jgi:hypothetical protein